MKKNWIIGIDVAGGGICFQIQNQTGGMPVEGSAPKSMEGYLDFKQVCARAGVRWPDTLVVIEATGRHHLPWCEHLIAEGVCVYALNPLLSKRLYSARNAIRDNKDDRLDAHSLSEIGRLHYDELERFTYRTQCDKIRLQTLVGARKTIRKQCTNLLKSAGDLLALVFPESRSLELDLKTERMRALLLRAPTPSKIAALPDSELSRLFGKDAMRLKECARNSFCPDGMAEACGQSLQAMLETIDDLFRQLKNLEHKIEAHLRARKDPQLKKVEELIRSLPGFGEVTAPTIAAFLPEGFEQWGNRKKIVAKLQAYFGCDPRRKESGQYKGKVKISKRGIEIVRTALYQASFCSLCHDPKLRAYYDKKKEEGDHHNKAIVDVIRKNLRRMVAVLIEQKPFIPEDEYSQKSYV
jgi:transposase